MYSSTSNDSGFSVSGVLSESALVSFSRLSSKYPICRQAGRPRDRVRGSSAIQTMQICGGGDDNDKGGIVGLMEKGGEGGESSRSFVASHEIIKQHEERDAGA